MTDVYHLDDKEFIMEKERVIVDKKRDNMKFYYSEDHYSAFYDHLVAAAMQEGRNEKQREIYKAIKGE